MSIEWGDVNARARGLATHLLGGPAWDALIAAPDLASFGRACVATGLLTAEPEPATAPALELGFRRRAAAQLGQLRRWLGPRAELLTIGLEDEERRGIRALLRGAAAGLAAEHRLSGLLPTPGLSERMLEALATRPRVPEVVALLVAWGHPTGRVLQPLAVGDPVDLFGLECALNRCFAERASSGARRGDRALRQHVALTIDRENLLGALTLAGTALERPAEPAFLPGGARLTLDRFTAAATAGAPHAALDRLAPDFEAPVVALLRRHLTEPAGLEWALLRLRIRELRRAARLSPLGPAPVLGFLLRLREEAWTLRQATWGAAFGTPSARRLPDGGSTP